MLAATVNIRTQHVDRATLSADSDGLVRRRALEHQRECAQDAERELRAQDAGSVRCSPARPRKFTGFPRYLPLAP
ncbi:MAG: hypothetical protein DMF90_16815 [Acidobacteria bacterium]|nr:MAG: hypothetical protein DMF90_16815 [Acidobacteriota bacterium]